MSGRPEPHSMIHACAIRITATAIALLALLMAGSAAQAQILYGSLTGTVTDKTGAVVPNVMVTLTDQGTGATRSVQASGVGTYSILNVLPGTYTLSISQSGNFGGFTQKDIAVEVNRQVRIDVTLQPASVSTQIMVTEAAPELQTETAEVNAEISQTHSAKCPKPPLRGAALRHFIRSYPARRR